MRWLLCHFWEELYHFRSKGSGIFPQKWIHLSKHLYYPKATFCFGAVDYFKPWTKNMFPENNTTNKFQALAFLETWSSNISWLPFAIYVSACCRFSPSPFPSRYRSQIQIPKGAVVCNHHCGFHGWGIVVPHPEIHFEYLSSPKRPQRCCLGYGGHNMWVVTANLWLRPIKRRLVDSPIGSETVPL